MTKSVFIGLIPFLLISCTIDQSSQPENTSDRQQINGRVSIPLTVTSSSGETYRVQIPNIELNGPNENISIDLDGAEEFDIALQEGWWQMAISHHWTLEKLNTLSGEFESVEAEMTSDNPQDFSIVGGETTSIIIRFETNAETVEFQNGELEIDIVVDDSNDSPNPQYADADGDGYTTADDCDDNNADINPAAEEICNGLDDNCNAMVDENSVDSVRWYVDLDGDGFGDANDFGILSCAPLEGTSPENTDCDDADNGTNPDAEDIPYDGIDQDCDGFDAHSPDPLENGEDLMAMSGPYGDGYGFVAGLGGHLIPADLSSSFYDVQSGSCQTSLPGPASAFYSIASIDHNEYPIINTGFAGAFGDDILSNFSNLEAALAAEELSIEDMSISFGWIDLGADEQGVNWDVFGDTEWRVYENNENSVFTISYAGEPMLVAPMAAVYMELDHNSPSDCMDDSITAITDRIYDLEISPEATPLNVVLGQAMLADISSEGLWMYMSDENAPLLRSLPVFSANNVLIGTGEQPF